MDDLEITELEKIDADRVDGVRAPASGIPILLMKGTAPAAKAADTVDCPTCKGDGKIMGGKRDCPDCDAKGQVTPDKAKSVAAKSMEALKGLSDGTVSINDALAAFGLPPVDLSPEGTAKTAASQIAPEETTVDTVTQTGDLEEVVKAAVAKAAAPLEERLRTLSDELAKVKATPVPSGLVLSRNVQVKQPGAVVNEDYAAKAAYYRDQASLWDSQDRGTADGYRKLAREADAKAVTPTS